MVLLLQTIPPLFVSSSLFGRWKENYYKEKLEWDAFKTFLSDFASIKKYAPDDLNMWQEWLVYATTLGVGDKVVEAMKQLNIQIPEVHAVTYMPIYFRGAYGMTSPPSPPSSGSGFMAVDSVAVVDSAVAADLGEVEGERDECFPF